MPSTQTDFDFVTVDVFTDQRFGGNQLAVFPDARGLTAEQMQAVASEFNLSETTFVLPPDNPANTARVRIFTKTYEMPFAGHPNVGTGWVLAQQNQAAVLRFEEIAGLVEIQVHRDASGAVTATTIAAPQPLALGKQFPSADIAACAGLAPTDVITKSHAPILASVGNPFVIAEVTAAALTLAMPDLAAFRGALAHAPDQGDRFAVFFYSRIGAGVRARMFAPLSGIQEDSATGSAASALAALLLSLTDAQEGAWDIIQGVEMGRPSLLRTTARRTPDGIRATVGGNCVPVLRGVASV